MLHLLNPLGLVALTALLVPAAIHLWRFPQRTVRLGSLKFLDTVARPRLNQWRWRERLLLLLRLLLVAVFALLLAQPEWRRTPGQPVRWALRLPNVELDGKANAEWGELLAKGYEAQTLATDDVWSALREADARVALGSSFVVVAPRRLGALHGARPQLAHATVQWIDAMTARTERWIDRVTRNADGRSLVVRVGISEATRTRFEQVTASVGAKSVTVDGVELALPSDGAETKPLRVMIFSAPDRGEDVRAVTAALTAVATVSGQAITPVLNPANAALAEADWAFVLGKAGPTEAELRAAMERGLNVVSDVGEAASVERAASFAWADSGRVALWRRGPVGTGEVLAHDSFGEPVLTKETTGHGSHFHFSSRFNSAWTDWTQSTAFPEWMRGLLLVEQSSDVSRARDQRAVAVDQVELRSGGSSVVIPQVVDLAHACWWLGLGLLAVERGLSHFWTRGRREGAS